MIKKSKEVKEKISEIWDTALQYTSEASKVSRQLAFGEGAIFWFFFRHQANLLPVIAIGLFFLVLYFIFDIAQYFIGSLKNKNLANFYEELSQIKILKPCEIIRKKETNSPTYFFYYGKIFMLAISSLLLFSLFIGLFICKA